MQLSGSHMRMKEWGWFSPLWNMKGCFSRQTPKNITFNNRAAGTVNSAKLLLFTLNCSHIIHKFTWLQQCWCQIAGGFPAKTCTRPHNWFKYWRLVDCPVSLTLCWQFPNLVNLSCHTHANSSGETFHFPHYTAAQFLLKTHLLHHLQRKAYSWAWP